MASYTINQINNDGTLIATSSVDNKPQNIDGLPLSDADSLTAALDNYFTAYEAGLAQAAADNAAPVVPADIHALIGKPQIINGD